MYIHLYYRSDGFPLTGYFIPGRVGSWVWPISRVVRRVVSCRVARHVVGHEKLVITQNTSVFIKNMLWGGKSVFLGDFFENIR